MEEKIKKIDFTIGIFENISDKIKDKIQKDSTKCETYGVGVYTNEFIINNYMTYPMKSQEERMKIAKEIPGVDFVFSVNSTDVNEVKKTIESVYTEYLKNKS